MKLADLSDEELVANLHALVGRTRTVLAYLLEYLGEVEERRIDLKSSCSSMFEYCVRRLGMSEDEACRRVAAARLVRRFPSALGMIERGEIHLTTLLLLREHLDEGNHEELLREAAGKTKMQVQELLAARSPRPDAPSKIVPLITAPAAAPATPAAGPSLSSLRLEPLAPERYEVQFTASAELRDKIERATDLMRHANPSGDLAVMVERAVDLLIADVPRARSPRAARARRNGRRREPGGEVSPSQPSRGGARVRARARREEKGREEEGREEESPAQRGSGDEVAVRALCGMGFKGAEARRALGIVAERTPGHEVPIETAVREAISLLT